MLQIALLEENELFRHSLKSLINNFRKMEVNLSVESIEKLQSFSNLSSFDILIFDARTIKSKDHCDILKSVLKRFPHLKSIALTDFIDKEIIMDLIKGGVTAYYSKEISPHKLEEIISDTYQSTFDFDIRLGPVIRQKLMANNGFDFKMSSQNLNISFSDREIQILQLVCKEKTNNEISELLKISVRTVETHRRRMIEKTDSKNIIGVVIQAIKLNIPLKLEDDFDIQSFPKELNLY